MSDLAGRCQSLTSAPWQTAAKAVLPNKRMCGLDRHYDVGLRILVGRIREDMTMRRTLLLAPVAGALALGAFLALKPSDSPAGPEQPPAHPAAPAPALSLPVAQAILYSSGVGYFQR